MGVRGRSFRGRRGHSKKEREGEAALELEVVEVIVAKEGMREGLSEEIGRGCRIRTGE